MSSKSSSRTPNYKTIPTQLRNRVRPRPSATLFESAMITPSHHVARDTQHTPSSQSSMFSVRAIGQIIQSPDLTGPRKRLEIRQPQISDDEDDQEQNVPSQLRRGDDESDLPPAIAIRSVDSTTKKTYLLTDKDDVSESSDMTYSTKAKKGGLLASPISRSAVTPPTTRTPQPQDTTEWTNEHLDTSLETVTNVHTVASRSPGKSQLEVKTFEPPTLSNAYVEQGYFTIPDSSYWKRCTEEQLRNQREYIVGREGYGKITWRFDENHPFPLEYLSGLELSNIIVIDKSSKTRYPRIKCYPDIRTDETPKRGTCLNIPARLTMFNVFPLGTGKKVTDSRKFYEKLRKRVENKKNGDAKFIGFNPERHTIEMQVPHFTEYSLFDEEGGDEEEEREEKTSTIQMSSKEKKFGPWIPVKDHMATWTDDKGHDHDVNVLDVLEEDGKFVSCRVLTREGMVVMVTNVRC